MMLVFSDSFFPLLLLPLMLYFIYLIMMTITYFMKLPIPKSC